MGNWRETLTDRRDDGGLPAPPPPGPPTLGFRLASTNDFGEDAQFQVWARGGFVFVPSAGFTYSGATLGFVNVPAGEFFRIIADGDLPSELDVIGTFGWTLFVSNADGTEQALLESDPMPSVPGAGVPFPNTAVLWTSSNFVGTDLSVGSQGQVISAAGGIFSATAAMVYGTD